MINIGRNSQVTARNSVKTNKKEEKCSTIAEIACTTDGFSTLCAAVKAAGLDKTLNSVDNTFTVFAPTDDAFDNLPIGLLDSLLEDVPTLTSILLFHAVPAKVFAKDLQCKETVEMANGNDSRTVCKGGRIFQKGAGNPRGAMPEIIATDIEACNGVVHVVSEVMLPPNTVRNDEGTDNNKCLTIAEIACNTEGFSTLCAAVQAAGLAGALSGDDIFTVFAPNNDAFDNLPEGTVEALLDDIPTLTNILLFHAVAGKSVFSNNLKCQKTIEMANGDDSRTVCRGDSIFQKGAGNPRKAMPAIIAADIEACNGVVHVVSEVMLPSL